MEYWIHTHGDITYCDGDAGADVPNHAIVVQDHLLQTLLDSAAPGPPPAQWLLDILRRYVARSDGVVDRVGLREALFCSADAVSRGVREIPDRELFDDDVEAWLCRHCEIDEKLFHVAVHERCVDKVRVFGLESLGWIRVCRNNLEVWRWNRKVHKQLRCGIDAICDDTGDDWPSWLFPASLHVRSDGRWVGGLSAAELDNFSAVSRQLRGLPTGV